MSERGGATLRRSRLSGWRAAALWLTVGSSLAAVAAATILLPESPENLPAVFGLVFTLMAASLGIVGALIVTRRPGNAVGWILLAASVSVAIAMAASDYARIVTASEVELPGRAIAVWVLEFALTPAIVGVIVLVPLLFPDGRLLSRRWRWAAAYGGSMVALVVVGDMFTPGPLNDYPAIMNPVGIDGFSALGPVFEFANGPGMLVGALLGIASSVLRYRRGAVVERTQLRWFGAATALTLCLFSLTIIFGDGPIAEFGWVGGIISISLIPVAIGIAILRYRLYEIDRIISRTLSWAIVTTVLVTILVGAIALLQAALSPFTKENTIAVAASTLVALALFQPSAAAYPASRRPAVRSSRLRRAANRGQVRRPVAVGHGPGFSAHVARDNGRPGRPPGGVCGVAQPPAHAMTRPSAS